MAHTIWKGSISLGLLAIPVKASCAARSETISFNTLHTCGSRINQQIWCPVCQRQVLDADKQKGYEVSKGQYIIVSEAELKACAPASSQVMEISSTVEAADVDPLCFDASYFLEPEPAGKKGYALLLAALTQENRYAVAAITMHNRENTVLIRPCRGALTFHTLFYEAEIRQAPKLEEIPVKPEELALAVRLLELNATPFDLAAYHDRYQTAVAAMLQAKQEGKVVPIVAKSAAPPVQDLLAALTASINSKKPGTPAPPKAKKGKKAA